ncbi:MAG: Smr/MutS family protein [Bacteroidota bacterium]|nr:Smr/MutS family protein [Bacteroidota bacterium]
MSFKVGDRVIFKKEKDKGEIVMLIGNLKALVRNSSGFDIQVMLSDLILYDSKHDSSSSYGNLFLDKDANNEREEDVRSYQKGSENKIDLHIQNLIDNFEGLSNQEIIDFQINHFQRLLNEAFKKNQDSLIVVHGIGTGILKEKIHVLLEEHNLRFYLSLDGGSTTILF